MNENTRKVLGELAIISPGHRGIRPASKQALEVCLARVRRIARDALRGEGVADEHTWYPTVALAPAAKPCKKLAKSLDAGGRAGDTEDRKGGRS